jgi:hypothetical protein
MTDVDVEVVAAPRDDLELSADPAEPRDQVEPKDQAEPKDQGDAPDAISRVEDEERGDKPWSVRARIRSFFYDWPGAAKRQWPLLLVIAAFVVGLVLIYFEYWRRGSFVVGGAVGLSGFLRLVLPERLAGLLVVRSKLLDVCFASGAGAVIMVLSLAVVPH